jgi:hypothetical protein
MSTTEVLNPPIPVERSRRGTIQIAAVVFGAILTVVAFGVGRAVLDGGSAHTHPAAVTTAPPQLEPLGTAAQLNAAFDTPEGRAAIAHEFAPGYFGGHPSTAAVPSASSPASPSTSDTVNCIGRGPC